MERVASLKQVLDAQRLNTQERLAPLESRVLAKIVQNRVDEQGIPIYSAVRILAKRIAGRLKHGEEYGSTANIEAHCETYMPSTYEAQVAMRALNMRL